MILGYLILIFPLVAVWSLLCYIPVYLYCRRKVGKRPFIRHLTIYAYIGTVISILFITVFLGGFPESFTVEYHSLNLVPFIWVKETYAMGFEKMIGQLLMNIVMLIPLGIFQAAVFPSMRRWWRMMLSMMLFVFCIETVQYFIGRSADIDDLIMNTLGGMAGYGIYKLLHFCLKNRVWWNKAVTM